MIAILPDNTLENMLTVSKSSIVSFNFVTLGAPVLLTNWYDSNTFPGT